MPETAMTATTETTAAMPSNPVLGNVPRRLWRKMSSAAAAQRAAIQRVSKGHKAYARTEVASSSMVILGRSTQIRCREPRDPRVRAPGSEADKLVMKSGLRANSFSPVRVATAAGGRVGPCQGAHPLPVVARRSRPSVLWARSEEHTSELQSRQYL